MNGISDCEREFSEVSRRPVSELTGILLLGFTDLNPVDHENVRVETEDSVSAQQVSSVLVVRLEPVEE